MVVARVGSAAAHVVCNMTDKQLADAGIDRRTFPMDAMKRMEAEFAAKDAEQATNVSVENSNVILKAAWCSEDDQIPLDCGSVGFTTPITIPTLYACSTPMCVTA